MPLTEYISNKFENEPSKRGKSPENFAVVGSPAEVPFPTVFGRQKATDCPMTKICRIQRTHYIVCLISEVSI